MSNAKDVVSTLITEMGSRPEDFILDRFTMIDQKTDMEIWIANGLLFYKVRKPFEIKFNFFQKFRLHTYIERLKAWKAINELTAEAS